jgi:hypothetical protein
VIASAKLRPVDRESLDSLPMSAGRAGGYATTVPTRHGVLLALIPPTGANPPAVVADLWPGWLQPGASRRVPRGNPSPFSRPNTRSRPKGSPTRRD